MELNRRLVRGYERYKDDPRIVELKKEVIAYNAKLEALGIRDHQVDYAKMHPIAAAGLFLYRIGKLVVLSVLVLPGTLLFSLVFIATKFYSIKKAREALAASNVKVQARDVMATWKLLVAMVAAPAAYAWYIIIGLFWYSRNNCNGYLPAGIQKRYLIIAQLIVYVTITYGSLRFGEVAMDILKSLGPLWKMMNPFSSSELVKLQERRKDLASRVNDIINELGPELYDDFDSKRIVRDPFGQGDDASSAPPTPQTNGQEATVTEPQPLPASPSDVHDIPRNESFQDLANQDIFSSRPQTPKKSRSRNASSANLGGFQLKPFSTIDKTLHEVQQRLSSGVSSRRKKRRSSGTEASWDDGDFESDGEGEGVEMARRGR